MLLPKVNGMGRALVRAAVEIPVPGAARDELEGSNGKFPFSLSAMHLMLPCCWVGLVLQVRITRGYSHV